jgi:hypothetical protein
MLVVAVCLLGGVAALAQDRHEKQEVVKLKNGHQVRGKIVTYAPLDSLVIQEEDGTLQTIYWDQIKQIVKDDWHPQRDQLCHRVQPHRSPQRLAQRFAHGTLDLQHHQQSVQAPQRQ